MPITISVIGDLDYVEINEKHQENVYIELKTVTNFFSVMVFCTCNLFGKKGKTFFFNSALGFLEKRCLDHEELCLYLSVLKNEL